MSLNGSSSHRAASSGQSSLAPSVIEDISASGAGTSQDHAASAAIITQTYDAVMDMKGISAQIDDSVRTLLANQTGNSRLIESALKSILRDKMKEISESQTNIPAADTNAATYPKSMLARRQAEQQSDPGLGVLPPEQKLHRVGVSSNDDSRLHRYATRSRTVGIRRFNFWFGTMVMTTTTRIRDRQDKKSLDMSLAQQTTETEIRLVPASFLTSSAMSATVTRIAAEYRKPTLFLNLEPLRIVHPHSPIIAAIRYGDLPEVRKLLEAGHAAVSDCFLDGKTLLDACFDSMDEFCELRVSEKNDYYVESFSREGLEKWNRIVQLAGWLVKQGVDPGRAHFRDRGIDNEYEEPFRS